MKNVSLQIELQKINSILCVRVGGELDHHTASQLKEQVEKELDTNVIEHIILNLENLTFMDSSGLGVVLGRYKQIRDRGEMIVVNVPSSISRLFEMSGLFKIIQVEKTENAALEKLGVELSEK